MKPTDQTLQQVERAIRKITEKFPHDDDTSVITDIHIRVSQDSGELMAYNDDDEEITRCLVEQWIDNKDDNFYHEIAATLREQLRKMHDAVDDMGILKPFSFVLEDDEGENIAELYVADDDTIIVGGDLMQGLDQDLDNFLDNLMKEE